MTYKVLERKSLEELAEAVNEFLAEGWRLQGGIAAVRGQDSKVVFYQALTGIERKKASRHPF
jgi:hypothetical protein